MDPLRQIVAAVKSTDPVEARELFRNHTGHVHGRCFPEITRNPG